ncbi:uncharacterized protein ACN427_013847 isoform 2-T2 [Glossina fuscipes fuscipes]
MERFLPPFLRLAMILKFLASGAYWAAETVPKVLPPRPLANFGGSPKKTMESIESMALWKNASVAEIFYRKSERAATAQKNWEES